MTGYSRSMDLTFAQPGPMLVLPSDLSLTLLSLSLLFWMMEILSIVWLKRISESAQHGRMPVSFLLPPQVPRVESSGFCGW